ncbi:cation:proton antiporter [Pseudomaricurvus sp. HS19]|uniref:cation:proton antiporter domain-containing protein n=1 Tax=Pseudomaricurvus sp. HS19 TaxID=2692626 RepID=UPI00136F6113|nr:cation:proton antiporter [Pseudomaricurvus sp. HS19]MYM62828.1 potassium transporter [Pseudomaricurvus sp. HS19]
MTDFLLLTFIFLVAGIVAVPLASRFALGSVLGYLIAGIAISPLLALLSVDVEAIQHFAEFGVVMMLFLVGLELDPKTLWAMRTRLIGLGGGQVIVTTLVVMGAGILLGHSWSIALVIGLVLALSSTAIVLQTLTEKGLLKSDGGQASFAVLLAQDIAVIPMLALIPLLALPELVQAIAQTASELPSATHDSFSLVEGLNNWQTALVTVVAVALVVLVGSYLTAPVFRFVAMARLRELFTAAALMFVIAIALLMSLVGLSPALGTFIAGVVLANSRYRHELGSNIGPFKGLLLGLFFITVGASIDFHLLNENLLLIIGLTLGLMALKGLVLFVLAALFRIRGSDKWLLALGLSQAGEFGFVLLAFSVSNGVLPAALGDQLLLVVALSMLLTPLLFIFYDRVIARLYCSGQQRQADTLPDDARIIIAGSGRVGGLVDRILRSAGFETTVIDFSADRLDALEAFGVRTYFGDATRPDLLYSAGIDKATLLVVALDDPEQIATLVQHVIGNYPHVHVLARAVDRHHVYDLYAYGCRDIVRETHDSSLRMGRSAFEALGIPKKTAAKMVEVFNDSDRVIMEAMADAYKIGIPTHENPEYVARLREVRDVLEPEVEAKMRAIREGDTSLNSAPG